MNEKYEQTEREQMEQGCMFCGKRNFYDFEDYFEHITTCDEEDEEE